MTVQVEKKLKFADDADDMGDFPLREGLSWRARRDAEVLRSIGRGTMFVGGDRGSGKDLFGSVVDYMNKYYFDRPVLLDFLPKKAFGKYGLFDARVMMQEINKMAKAGGVEGITETQDQKEYDEFIEEAVKDWALEGEGAILLKNAVIHLSELKRYCYKRNPHNRFNKFVGSLNTVVRHLDALIIGTHTYANEIDEFTFMQYANIRANCEWCVSEAHTTKVKIALRGIIGADFAYGKNILLKPFYYYVNGDEQRSFIGFDADPRDAPFDKRFYGIYKTKSMVNLKPVLRKEM